MRFFKIFSVLVILSVLFYLIAFASDTGIYDDVLRLHVIANSDNEEDQELKLSVRDYVIKKYSAELSKYKSREEALENVKKLLPYVEKDINEYLKDYFGYSCTVSVEETYFPTKSYGEYSLPKGYYDALCIRLGKAEGQNYWCVLFPPLCLGASIADDEKLFEECGLSKDEYNLMRTEKPQYRLKFKLLEMFAGK